MNIDPEVIAKIAGPALSLIVGAQIKHYVEARSKVVSFTGHASAFTIQGENPAVIHTHSVVVRNAGRKAATNVRLVHAVRAGPTRLNTESSLISGTLRI